MSVPPARELTNDQAIVWSWAVRELAPWLSEGLAKPKTETACKATAEEFLPAFAFRITNKTVTILEKIRSRDDPGLVGYAKRAELYQELFQQAVDTWCPELDVVLCANMDDGPYSDSCFPVFSFQKLRGANEPLLPDVDFLINNFYTDIYFHDYLDYYRKHLKASFVGSATGGRITLDTVRNLSLPRLEAAAHFYQDPDVEFRLPLLVDCDSAETRQALAALPFCGGETASWVEQRANRFLISMDGNGATCSRVAVSLMSNSVLLKYASEYTLYYFGGLAEWLHFVPVHSHYEVKRAIDLERALPGALEHIARRGQEFAETYLSRDNIIFYTAAILSLYSRCFNIKSSRSGSDASGSPTAGPGEHTKPNVDWKIVAHISGLGDTLGIVNEWVGIPGSRQWIEGFSIDVGEGVRDFQLTYCTLLPDGTSSPWKRSGSFCGSRGRSLPLLGLCVRLGGRLSAIIELKYEARFLDGFASELVDSEQMCVSPSRSPLEAFRITVQSASI